MEPSTLGGTLTHDCGCSEKILVLGVKPSSKEQPAGQGLRLWGFIFMQSHGWAKLQPSHCGSERSRAGTGPWPCLPGPRAVTSAFPWHLQDQLATRRSLLWRPQGLPEPSARGRRSRASSTERNASAKSNQTPFKSPSIP